MPKKTNQALKNNAAKRVSSSSAGKISTRWKKAVSLAAKFAKKQKAEQSEILATELAAVCNVNLNVAPAQNPVAAANAAPMDIEASNSGPARQ